MSTRTVSNLKSRLIPLLLTFGLLIADQITKAIVIARMPVGVIYKRFLGDFIWLVHVRNKGAAFSIGADSSVVMRIMVLILLPLLVMAVVLWAILSSRNILNGVQRWFAAGVLGGGLGTLVDRIFRFDEGVVDFISIDFYGFLGLERWPTFNVSDSCVVVFVILLALSILFEKKETHNDSSKEKN